MRSPNPEDDKNLQKRFNIASIGHAAVGAHKIHRKQSTSQSTEGLTDEEVRSKLKEAVDQMDIMVDELVTFLELPRQP